MPPLPRRGAAPADPRPGTWRVLHVGSGPRDPARLQKLFHGPGWAEVRVDIDPRTRPDHVGSVTDLTAMAGSGTFQAVWCSHCLEHLHAHEVPLALAEFARVLHPTGFALVTCPDAEVAARHLLDGGLERPLYQSLAGPIAPIDILFGHRDSVAQGNPYMRHNTAFTQLTLGEKLLAAGFPEVRVMTKEFDLWAVAFRDARDLEVKLAVLAEAKLNFM